MKSEATPGREELLAGLIQDAISVLHHDTTDGSDVDKYERECLRKKFSARLAARLAAKPADDGTIPIPKAAFDWLNGEGPDADGKWFSDDIPQSDVSPRRAYWWRSKFRSMIPALSTTTEPKR